MTSKMTIFQSFWCIIKNNDKNKMYSNCKCMMVTTILYMVSIKSSRLSEPYILYMISIKSSRLSEPYVKYVFFCRLHVKSHHFNIYLDTFDQILPFEGKI